MAEASAAVLDELADHLRKVDQDPTTPLDIALLEKCELFASTPQYRTQLWKETRPIFLQVASLLPSLQQDPAPLIHFVLKLAAPYRFEDIKDLDFEVGLDLGAQPFHTLILSLLEKAAASQTDAHLLANRPGVMLSVVRLWLCTQDAGVATQAANMLISLLRISRDEVFPAQGQEILHQYGSAPIWKRLFHDRDIYALYYQYTTLTALDPPVEPALSKRDKTIAQARLLEWLPRVGELDWRAVVSSHGPEVERQVQLTEGQGLLHYASLKMVDTADDILMHMTLINFFSDLITTVKEAAPSTQRDTSLALDFLEDQGIHKGIIDFHTSENPGLEHSFLSSRTAHYISEYASTYPEDFEKCEELERIRQYVHRSIRKCEANDLSLLASMPRATTIPHRHARIAWDEAVFLDIPVARTNPDALKTLAVIFHGPEEETITFPRTAVSNAHSDERNTIEKVFARLSTSLFHSKNPSFFSDIVKHADLIAMKENALAALGLLRAIITSNWDSRPLPERIPDNDPVYARLQQFPQTGVDAVLDPSISGAVLSYLMKPATTFSNLVGGRGDAENAAYQIAMAKFDVLKALGERLEKEPGRQDVHAMVRRRVAEGPWGVGGNAGSRIGTLEL